MAGVTRECMYFQSETGHYDDVDDYVSYTTTSQVTSSAYVTDNDHYKPYTSKQYRREVSKKIFL